MITTLLLTLTVATLTTKPATAATYPKDPRQNIAVLAQTTRPNSVPTRAGAYPKDISANLAQPAAGTPFASQKFKQKGAYPKDPRNNLARP